jgi:hypothetical protein
MKTYGGMDVQNCVFLTSALVGGEWSASFSDGFIPEDIDPVPIELEAGWARESAWTRWGNENL